MNYLLFYVERSDRLPPLPGNCLPYLFGQESMAWGLDAIAALYTLSSLTLVLCLTALGKNKGLNE